MPRETSPSIIVFDVNETLLDITALEPLFERVFSAGKQCSTCDTQRYLSRTLSITPNLTDNAYCSADPQGRFGITFAPHY